MASRQKGARRCLVIDRCFNPACMRRLDYLRDGRVVRVIRGKDEDITVEHYWLCGACYHVQDFVFPPDGSVMLKDRSNGNDADDTDEFTLRDVLLPDRRKIRR